MCNNKSPRNLAEKIDDLAIKIEKLKLAEYLEVFRDTKRLLYVNFLGGLARGLGMAIGFTFLGALVIYILQRLVVLRLPIIGNILAKLIKIIQHQLN